MPMDRSKYPANWPEISFRIRFGRAKGRCEECDAPHFGWRDRETGDWFESDFQLWPRELAHRMIRIVLTTAHLGIDKPDGSPGSKEDTMDCREENLKALCQRCHLNFDRADHVQSRYRNRRARQIEAGQQEMF